MTRPMIRIHDSQTDEIIDREMTIAEFKQYEEDQKQQAQIQLEIEAKESARQAIADRLGLTVDELQVLLG